MPPTAILETVLYASDLAAAEDFYGRVLGWTHVPLGPEAGGYGFFSHEGRTVAAVGPLSEPGAASAWTIYFATPDADALTRAVTAAGGVVRLAPFDVFTSGRMAQLTDPGGAEFAVWQAVEGIDDPDIVLSQAFEYGLSQDLYEQVADDEHTADGQREANLLCWLYGSDPQSWDHLIDDDPLTDDRAELCVDEWDLLVHGWSAILAQPAPAKSAADSE